MSVYFADTGTSTVYRLLSFTVSYRLLFLTVYRFLQFTIWRHTVDEPVHNCTSVMPIL